MRRAGVGVGLGFGQGRDWQASPAPDPRPLPGAPPRGWHRCLGSAPGSGDRASAPRRCPKCLRRAWSGHGARPGRQPLLLARAARLATVELMERRLLDALAYLQSGLGVLCLLLVCHFGTSYGRYWSPRFAWRVPARSAWALQELPSLAVPLLLCARAPTERLRRWPNGILLAMFLVHYAHRSLIFPFLIRGGKPTPFYTWSLAFIFCAFNGYLQGRYLSQYAVYDEGWVTDPRFLTGFVLWLTGMLINIHSDHILRNLRKPGETGYKIPRGGLFEYVTAANYFGEVIEWSGFALASWSIQGMAFAVFTFCFLLGRAKQHHQWYLEKFEDYPKFRKILIPFLV